MPAPLPYPLAAPEGGAADAAAAVIEPFDETVCGATAASTGTLAAALDESTTELDGAAFVT
ncbi:MAG TPA: hypothetical protein VHT05_08230, partial [Candidatus Elarobacter sp.]|nr:hypothetical protein [Candidatus Elarobacter sp.]